MPNAQCLMTDDMKNAIAQVGFWRSRFVDVPSSFWAAAAIQTAYEKAFISGFPDKTFRSA
ncbi:S-layer homology domain-containing protein, partial [Nostoc linckia]|uniref:S-layer homology domain-containing protein n=1 Tax=Nostoc linckia TaxID=92942 RepID=UPI00117E0B4E